MKQQTAAIPAKGAQRRSTRISSAVSVVITSTGKEAKGLVEETATLSISCHGCCYFSKNGTRPGARVAIQVNASKEDSNVPMPPYPARVVWRRKSKRLHGLYQIGIEFDTPLNLWSLDDSPEDWKLFDPEAKTEPEPQTKEDAAVILAEAERLLHFVHKGTHYELLVVDRCADRSAVKQNFYHLAQRFHPDRNMAHPELTPRLLVLMDALTTAYKILSDQEEKKQFDSSIAQRPPQNLNRSESKRAAKECLERARECLVERNYVGSILWLRRAIDNEPDTSGYRAMLAQSLASIPEYRREAIEQFEKALDLDPDNITAHIQYGELLEKMKLPSRARHHYVRVLELVMDHREARNRLSRLDAATPRPALRSSLLGRLTGRR